ncbi:FAFR459Wp [Eremothecium gossypii FDAG1]|nr:FAFR459Wp [Eremothecium gossypii FDAG1]
MPMAIKSLFIINKSGGLVYQRDFLPSTNTKMSSNEYLILAGTLHGVIAIASQLTPKALQISNQGSSSTGAAVGAAGEATVPSMPYGSPEHTIPYIPGLAPPVDNKAPGRAMGSYLAPDYFSESFPSWNRSGLKSVVMDECSLFVYQSLTGVKFILLSTNQTTSNAAQHIAENLLRKIYCIYSDYVMKNPFYSADMLIRSEPFDKRLQALVASL